MFTEGRTQTLLLVGGPMDGHTLELDVSAHGGIGHEVSLPDADGYVHMYRISPKAGLTAAESLIVETLAPIYVLSYVGTVH